MYQRNHPLHSPKVIERRQRRLLWGFSATLIILISGFFVAGQLSHLPQLSIASIALIGNATVANEAILKAVESDLSGNYLGILSKRNIALFPRQTIEKKLLEDFPRLESVAVSREGNDAILVELKERKPRAIACDGVNGGSSIACFFVGDDGFIFSPAPDFSGYAFVRFLGESDKTLAIGSYYETSPSFEELLFFINSLKEEGLVLTEVIFLPEGDVELSLYGGGRLFISGKIGLSQTFENIKTLLEGNQLKRSLPNLSLDYIDLRYGNKVFYKNR